MRELFEWLDNIIYGEKNRRIEGLEQSLDGQIQINEALSKDNKNLSEALATITNDMTALRTMNDEQIAKLKHQIELLTAPSILEEKLNSKYPKRDILYPARTLYNKTLTLDPRGFFINPKDGQLQKIVRDWLAYTDDEKVWNCFKYVCNKITYKDDLKTSGYSEMWYFPQETLAIKCGDCEDMHILLANLMLASGVPYYKIRLVCGDVYNTKGELEGGHCWLVYYVESLGYWVALDTCFYSSSTPLLKRTDYKKSSIYGGDDSIWFSWNQKYMFKK